MSARRSVAARAALSLVVVGLSARDALAQEAPLVPPGAATASVAPTSPVTKARKLRFGGAGQVVVASNFGLGFSAGVYDDPNVYATSVDVGPELAVFVVPNVSLGGGLTGDWSKSQGYSTHGSIDRHTATSFGGFASVGYNIELGRYASIWLQAHLGYSHSATVVESSDAASVSGLDTSDLGGIKWRYASSGAYASGYAPLVIHPAPHFFLGAGPYVYRDLGRTNENSYPVNNDRTTVSLRLTVGVWF